MALKEPRPAKEVAPERKSTQGATSLDKPVAARPVAHETPQNPLGGHLAALDKQNTARSTATAPHRAAAAKPEHAESPHVLPPNVNGKAVDESSSRAGGDARGGQTGEKADGSGGRGGTRGDGGGGGGGQTKHGDNPPHGGGGIHRGTQPLPGGGTGGKKGGGGGRGGQGGHGNGPPGGDTGGGAKNHSHKGHDPGHGKVTHPGGGHGHNVANPIPAPSDDSAGLLGPQAGFVDATDSEGGGGSSSTGGSGMLWILAIGVVAVVVYFIYKNKHKKKAGAEPAK